MRSEENKSGIISFGQAPNVDYILRVHSFTIFFLSSLIFLLPPFFPFVPAFLRHIKLARFVVVACTMLRIRNKRENVKNVENIYIVAKDYSFKIGVKKYLKNRKIVFLVPRVEGGGKRRVSRTPLIFYVIVSTPLCLLIHFRRWRVG